MIYKATAILPNGEVLTAEGTIQDCSNWADNVIRSWGTCTITVEREENE